MRIFLVLGGPLAGRQACSLTPDSIQIVGMFGDYDEAVEAWRSASQSNVDDAESRYLILPLHRLIEPMLALEHEQDVSV